MKILIISISTFLLLVSYQNCGQVSENIPSTEGEFQGTFPDSEDGDINCLAVATNDIEIGYLFPHNYDIPNELEVQIGDEVVYSTCNEENEFFSNGNALPISAEPNSDSRFHIYRSFDTPDDMYANLNIKLYAKDSCAEQGEVIYNSDEEYEPYQRCGQSAIRLSVEYVIPQ